MWKLAWISFSIAGCASGGPIVPAHTTSVSVVDTGDALRVAPLPIDPKLPSVDRIAERVRYSLGDSASTEVQVCIRPSGKVASVELVGGSALPAFDLAVVDDASAWRFTSLPGPEKLESCERATVAYHLDR